jgi:uncharacterized protein (TIGR00251 family)
MSPIPLGEPTFVRNTPTGCTVTVRIHPGAQQDAITGIHDGALKISLTTPPVDGRANDALVAYLATSLRLPRARIMLLTGHNSRSKILSITGKSAAEVQVVLNEGLVC